MSRTLLPIGRFEHFAQWRQNARMRNHTYKTKRISPIEELITKKELSRRLKVCTRTVENLTNKGLIPVVRVGASPRYCWDDVSYALKNTSPTTD